MWIQEIVEIYPIVPTVRLTAISQTPNFMFFCCPHSQIIFSCILSDLVPLHLSDCIALLALELINKRSPKFYRSNYNSDLFGALVAVGFGGRLV